MAVLVFMAVTVTFLMATGERTSQAARQITGDQARSEAVAIARFFHANLHCANTLKATTTPMSCPTERTFKPFFRGRSVSESVEGGTSPLAGSYHVHAATTARGRWQARLVCTGTKLELRLGLWDDGTKMFAKDVLTGGAIDFQWSVNPLTSSDRGLCAQFFGGLAASKLYGMSIADLQEQSHFIQGGVVTTVGNYRCDAKWGKLVDWYQSKECENSDICKAFRSTTGFAVINSVANKTAKTAAEAWIGPLNGQASCGRFCRRSPRNFTTGRLIRCDPTKVASGIVTRDSDLANAQTLCHCLR